MALVNPLSGMNIPTIQAQQAPMEERPLMTDQDVSRAMSAMSAASPRQGLLSRIGDGLLGAGQAVGSGLLGAGRAAVAGIDPEQMSRDIIDTQRFYRQAQMSQPSMVLGSDLAKLQNITPQGIAASLPALRAQEKLALQKPEIEKLEALAALERAKGGGQSGARYKFSKTLVNVDDPNDFVHALVDTVTGKYVRASDFSEIDNEKYKLTTSTIQSKGQISAKDLRASTPDLLESESALRQGQMFLDRISDFEGGFSGKMTNIKSKFKTFFGQDLTPQELASQAALGGQQGLLGAIRREVVGAGVLTEPDAIRVMERLGGYAGDWTANPELIGRAVREVMQEKYLSYREMNENYNFDASSLGRRTRPTINAPMIGPPEGYYNSGGTDDLWSQLTYDQKQRVRKQYQ
jgi:hypothetical protein